MSSVQIDLLACQQNSDLIVDCRMQIIARSIKTQQSRGLGDQVLPSNTNGGLNNLKDRQSVFVGRDAVRSTQR
jgi:hypothetical protein